MLTVDLHLNAFWSKSSFLTPEYKIQGLFFSLLTKMERRIKTSLKTSKSSCPAHLVHYPTFNKACFETEYKNKKWFCYSYILGNYIIIPNYVYIKYYI